jgi:hypothetical protein
VARLAEILETRGRHRGARQRRRIGVPEPDETIGFGKRERRPEHGAHYREDGRIGADAERERQHRDEREAGSTGEQPQSVTNVVQHRWLDALRRSRVVPIW